LSHFTSVKTRIRDLTLLNAAAKALGLKPVDRKTVRGWLGQQTQADVVWEATSKYDIGAVRKPDGTYELIADWWAVKRTAPGISDNRLKQEYSVQTVIRQAKLLGQQVSKETLPNGSIRLIIQ
jgi:hypothetical protein